MWLRARLQTLWHHLFRAAAQRAWAIVGVCFAVYVVLDARDTLPQLQEFALIVAGVAAGAIFLPELSASLWDLDPARIRSLIPLPKVRGLHRAIVDASLETDASSVQWASVVWSQAIEPLLEAGAQRSTIVWDVSYDISVHPDHVLPSDLGALPVTFVATRLRSRRLLPVTADGTVWVSATRTASALHNEFQMLTCLLRELVPLSGVDPSAWRAKILASCQVKLTVNGTSVPLRTSGDEPIPDIVRWEATIDRADITDGYVAVEVSFDYPMDATATDFPVMFPRYYCAGTTRIAFTLYSPEAADLELRAHSFLAHALGQPLGDSELDRTPMLQRFVFESSPETLLWPGSGVHFEWPSRTAEVKP